MLYGAFFYSVALKCAANNDGVLSLMLVSMVN